MATRRFIGLATAVMLATLRLLWRRRLLVVVVVVLGLLFQHMYCQRNPQRDPRIINPPTPGRYDCVNPPCTTGW